MALEQLHDFGHRELFGHDFALINPMRVAPERWRDLPVVALRAPAFEAQPHLVPRLLPLRGLEDEWQVELLERNGRQGVETGQPLFCALLAGRADAASVAAALGARMLLRTPSGGTAWLRFHDPRVFSALAWWLDAAQMRCMLGPLLSWTWFDPRDRRWHRIRRPGPGRRASARLQLTAAQWERLGRQSRVNRCLKLLSGGAPAGPLRPLVEGLDRHLAAGGGEGAKDLDDAGFRQWMRTGVGPMEEHA